MAGNGSKSLTIFARKLHHRYLTYFLIHLCRYTKSYYSSSTRFAENPSNSMIHSSERVISKTGLPEKILEISVKARHFKVYNKVTFDRPFENRKNVYFKSTQTFTWSDSNDKNWGPSSRGGITKPLTYNSKNFVCSVCYWTVQLEGFGSISKIIIISNVLHN